MGGCQYLPWVALLVKQGRFVHVVDGQPARTERSIVANRLPVFNQEVLKLLQAPLDEVGLRETTNRIFGILVLGADMEQHFAQRVSCHNSSQP